MNHAPRSKAARSSTLAILGLLGCTASPAGRADGPATPSGAATASDAATAGDGQASNGDNTDAAKSNDAPTLGPGAWHIGVLSQRGNPDCSEGRQQWVDTQPVIGWISTDALSDEEAKWLDFPVVAHGKWTAAPTSPATTVKGECPPPQARSDWRFTPRGLRIQRGGGRSGGAHLERDYMRPLVDLTATTVGDEIVVDFRNPLPVALQDVVIRIHYEGCMGKPGTLSREHAVGTLEPRAGTRSQLPRLAGRSKADPDIPPDHAARSVQIEATGTDVTLDLDVPLGILGAKVECPAR